MPKKRNKSDHAEPCSKDLFQDQPDNFLLIPACYDNKIQPFVVMEPVVLLAVLPYSYSCPGTSSAFTIRTGLSLVTSNDPSLGLGNTEGPEEPVCKKITCDQGAAAQR